MARKKQRETYGNGSIVPVVDEAGNQSTIRRVTLFGASA